MPLRRRSAPALLLLSLAACRDASPSPDSTAVVAAVAEPATVLPPLVQETVGRDIGDLVYERLAILPPGAVPSDAAAWRPGLAAAWTAVDSVTWRFTLREGARWHDGTPVTAADVVFSFAAYADTALGAPYARGLRAEATDARTVTLRFPAPSPEPVYDAAWSVRILPKHVWDALPRAAWAADTALAHLVGSGPYRLTQWVRGQSLVLEADARHPAAPALRRLVWRFTADADAALNLVLAGEADLLETIGANDRIIRVEADSAMRVERYPAATYGFLGFRVADDAGTPHPVLGDRAVRRALTQALDRETMAVALVGPGTTVPAGPFSALLWVKDAGTVRVAHDSAAAAAALDAAGWRRGPGGVRRKGGRPLALELLVPTSSGLRRRYAEAIEAAWRGAGVQVTIRAVEFPVFQQRLAAGDMDAYLGAYLDEPSPRGIADQWGSAGLGGLNQARYRNPVFDSLVTAAGRATDVAGARATWRAALDTLNTDAPAIWLFTPVQAAAVRRRFEGVTIDPFSWLATLPGWRVAPR